MKQDGGNLKLPKPMQSVDVSPAQDKMALNKSDRGGIFQKGNINPWSDDKNGYLKSSGGGMSGKGKKK